MQVNWDNPFVSMHLLLVFFFTMTIVCKCWWRGAWQDNSLYLHIIKVWVTVWMIEISTHNLTVNQDLAVQGPEKKRAAKTAAGFLNWLGIQNAKPWEWGRLNDSFSSLPSPLLPNTYNSDFTTCPWGPAMPSLFTVGQCDELMLYTGIQPDEDSLNVACVHQNKIKY